MSYKDFVEAQEAAKNENLEPPIFGDAQLAAETNQKATILQVKFFIADMGSPSDLGEAERILTQSLRCGDQVEKLGDICVFKEETNFNKDGSYTVVLKYAECMAAEDTSSTEQEEIDIEK